MKICLPDPAWLADEAGCETVAGCEMPALMLIGGMHVIIGLVAIGYGVLALLRDGIISSNHRFGQLYLVATVLACMTAFGLFRNGFGAGHWLAVLTLAVMFAAALIGKARLLGGASLYVETIGYSATLLFHLLSAATEIGTRLPLGAPWASGPMARGLLLLDAALVLLFLAVSGLQVRMLSQGEG